MSPFAAIRFKSLLGMLIYGGLVAGFHASAADWETQVDGRTVLPEPLSQRALNDLERPLLLPAADGWWLLGDPGIASRRLIARFAVNSNEVQAATVVVDNYKPDASVLSDGSLAVVLNRDNYCPFNPTCSDIATLEVRNADTSLRWNRRFKGPCSTPVSRGSELILACANQLHRLDADGYSLTQKSLGGASGTIAPVLVDVADGDLLLLRHDQTDRASLQRVGSDLNPRWRRDWDDQFNLIGVGETAVYLNGSAKFRGEEATQPVLSVALIGGEVVFEHQVAGELRAAVQSADAVYAIVDGQATQQLVLINSRGQRRLSQAEPGEFMQDLLAESNGFVMASTADRDTAQLTRFFSSGVVLGIRRFSQPRSIQRLYRVGPGTYGLVSWPSSIARFPTVELLSFQGERLTPALTSVVATLGTSGGTVDASNRSAWVGGQASTQLGDYLARSAFDGSNPALFLGEATTDYSYRVLLGPSAVGDRYCVARVPASVIPQPSDSGISDLLCASRTGSESERLAVTVPGVWPFGIALGATEDGKPKILSSLNRAGGGYPLFSTVADFDGSSQSTEGAVIEGPFGSLFGGRTLPDGLLPDLSGLLGTFVLDADARELYRVAISGRYIADSWRLSDGGWLLYSLPVAPFTQSSIRLTRVDAQGLPLWQYEELLPPIPGPRVSAAEHGGRVVVELLNDPGPGVTGRRLQFDLATGGLIGAVEELKDAQFDESMLLSLDPAQGGRGLWRLRPVGDGILAEPIAPRSAPYWLPCALAECQLQAHAVSAEGALLAKLGGDTQAGYSNQLVSVDLDALSLAAAGAGEPDRTGRWHDSQALHSGLLVGRDPATRNLIRFWIGDGGSDANGAVAPLWWRLDDGAKIGPVIEQQIQFPSARLLAAPFTDTQGYASLRPLLNDELYLTQHFDRRSLGELSELRVATSHHRLQRRASSAHTQLYLADSQRWIALDKIAGEGLWARPDGRWYRLRRDTGERWLVSLEVQAAAVAGADRRPSRSVDLALGQLRVTSCGSIEWRLLRTLAADEGRLRDAFQGRRYELGERCR